jgi:heat-inducible transcriptional repressor
MTDDAKLDARKRQILLAVIREHIESAEPVGSEAVTQRANLSVSSATIRHEFTALTEMGFLRQPHTSSGRVPTDLGYRLYVDTMLDPESLSGGERARIRVQVGEAAQAESELAVEKAAQTLAALSHYPSIAIAPSADQRRFQQLHLISLTDDHAMAVIVTDGGLIEGRPLRLAQPMARGELDEISRMVSHWLQGRMLAEITDGLLERLMEEAKRYRALLEEVRKLLRRHVQTHHTGRVFVEGLARLLQQPEFQDVRRAAPPLSALDSDDVLRDLLHVDESGALTVRIGRENARDEMQECSLISAAYWINGRPVGVIGVVGPTRMRYGKMISLVRTLAESVSDALSRDEEK